MLAILIIFSAILALSGCQVQSEIQLINGSCDLNWKWIGELDLAVPRPDGTEACLINLDRSVAYWRWSKDSSRLAFSFLNRSEETIYFIMEGDARPHKALSLTGNRGIGAGWRLSSDGSYIITSASSPSYGVGITVIDGDTAQEVCSLRAAPGDIGSFNTCSYLELKDGQWWHFNSGLILPEKNPALASDRIADISTSPNGIWVLIGYKSGGNISSLSLYHKDSGKMYQVKIPYLEPEGQCIYSGSTRWSPDSNHFALYDRRQRYIFIWSIIQEPEPSFSLVSTAEASCLSGTPIEWPATD